MDYEIAIWCSKCGGQSDGNDNAYCESCFDNLVAEVNELKEEISRLEDENRKLEESHKEGI